MEAMIDLDRDEAIEALQASRSPYPCDGFEPISGWLAEFCFCGWNDQSHDH